MTEKQSTETQGVDYLLQTLEPTQTIRCEPSLNQFGDYLFKKILSGKHTALSLLLTQYRLFLSSRWQIVGSWRRARAQCLVKMDGQVGRLAEIRSANIIKGCGGVLETM